MNKPTHQSNTPTTITLTTTTLSDPTAINIIVTAVKATILATKAAVIMTSIIGVAHGYGFLCLSFLLHSLLGAFADPNKERRFLLKEMHGSKQVLILPHKTNL